MEILKKALLVILIASLILLPLTLVFLFASNFSFSLFNANDVGGSLDVVTPEQLGEPFVYDIVVTGRQFAAFEVQIDGVQKFVAAKYGYNGCFGAGGSVDVPRYPYEFSKTGHVLESCDPYMLKVSYCSDASGQDVIRQVLYQERVTPDCYVQTDSAVIDSTSSDVLVSSPTTSVADDVGSDGGVKTDSGLWSWFLDFLKGIRGWFQ